MNINELFEKLQDELNPEELNGEFLIQFRTQGNIIIWTYSLEEDSEEIEYDGDEENFFSFEACSSEELLQEAYQEDLEKLNNVLDEYEQTGDWDISDFESTDNVISFNIS